MKKILSCLGVAAALAMGVFAAEEASCPLDCAKACCVKDVYGFKVQDIDGKEVNLADYKGKVLLIVNVASKCGLTPQYKELVEVYDEFKDDGLVILGFPANEFNGQEPGTNAEIKEFCALNYKVDFPMFSKVVVKGEGQAPLFQYLTTAENPDKKGEISWNFEKFLVNKEGQLVRRFEPKMKPNDEKIIEAIKEEIKS